MSHETYEVFALRYGERPERTRQENFLEPVDAASVEDVGITHLLRFEASRVAGAGSACP